MGDKSTCCYDYAKKLRHLGVKCCSEFSWVKVKADCDDETIKCVVPTKEVEDCEKCSPALTLDECAIILKRCRFKASWREDGGAKLKIELNAGAGSKGTSLTLEKEEKDCLGGDCDIACRAIIHLIECGEIDACFVNCILKKCTGYCYEPCEKKEDCEDDWKADDECKEKCPCKEELKCIKDELKCIGEALNCFREFVEKQFCEVQDQLKCIREDLGCIREELGEVRKDVCEIKKDVCEIKEKLCWQGEVLMKQKLLLEMIYEKLCQKDECKDDKKDKDKEKHYGH